MISYFTREMTQAIGKVQELLLDMIISKKFLRHRDIRVRVSSCHLQLASESDKTENVSTNKIDLDFKEGSNTAETKKKVQM